jgi:hypothetical protein
LFSPIEHVGERAHVARVPHRHAPRLVDHHRGVLGHDQLAGRLAAIAMKLAADAAMPSMWTVRSASKRLSRL